MKLDDARLPLPFAVIGGGIATCAAVGLAFLMLGSRMPDPLFVVPAMALVIAALLMLGLGRTVTRVREDAESSAVNDPLSGVLPVHLGRRLLEVAFAGARRGQSLSIVLFRIDGMPRHAALRGHPGTVRLMRLAGRALNTCTRGMHVCSRHRGHATFLSILTGVRVDGACTYAANVRREYTRLVGDDDLHTLSAGAVEFVPDMRSPEDLLRSAERALALAWAERSKIVRVERVPPPREGGDVTGPRPAASTEAVSGGAA